MMPIHYFLMSWDLLNPFQHYPDYVIEAPEKDKMGENGTWFLALTLYLLEGPVRSGSQF